MDLSYKVILDRRFKLKDGLHSLALRVTFPNLIKGGRPKVKYYYLNERCSEKDFNAANSSPRTFEQKRIHTIVHEHVSKVRDIISRNAFVGVDLFELEYLNTGKLRYVSDLFDAVIKELREQDRIGTADTLVTARNRIVSFSGPELMLFEITKPWLLRFERELLKTISETSVGIYIRSLRSVYNYAMNKRIVSPDLYPFGKAGYKVPKGNGTKQALHEDDKNRLISYEFKDKLDKFHFDMWRFSYFCNGINFKDICMLRYSSVRNGFIYYSRQKTRRTSAETRVIEVPIHPIVAQIIKDHGVKTLSPDALVFPILQDGLSEKTLKNRVDSLLKKTNAVMKRASVDLGLPFKVTTYTARHTFATILLRKGVGKEFIQEALGHSSMATTESYLKGFESDKKREVSGLL